MTITYTAGSSGDADNTIFCDTTSATITKDHRVVVQIDVAFIGGSHTFVVGDLTKLSGTATLGTITLDKSQVQNNGSDNYYALTFSADVTGTGTIVFRCAGDGNGRYWNYAVSDISSNLGAMTVGNVNAAGGATGAPDSGNVTSTNAAIIMGCVGVSQPSGTVTITQDAAFTLIFEEENASAHMNGSMIYRIVGASTTDSASWTAPTTIPWTAVVVEYEENSGATSLTTPAAFGEQTPTNGETAISWATWSDGAGGHPAITGDPDWGKLHLPTAESHEGRSQVYDLGSSHNRLFVLTENRYGS
jgi:hypothetical protein